MEKSRGRSWRVAGAVTALMLISAACSAASSTATSVPTPLPTATPAPTVTPTLTPEPTPTPAPTATVYAFTKAPAGPVNDFTRVVIDGTGTDDWASYPVIVAPLSNQPEFQELRAFYNDRYLYILITVTDDVRVAQITASLDLGGDIDPEYFFLVTPAQEMIQLGRWPPVGAAMRPMVGFLERGSIPGFQIFEVKLPLSDIDPFGTMLIRVRTAALGYGASGVSEFMTDRLPELEQSS